MLCREPENFSSECFEILNQKVSLTVESMSQYKFDEIARQYDVLLVRFNTMVNSKVMDNNSNVKTIISPTTGLDHIDLQAAKNFGVSVFSLRGERDFLDSVSGTAELAIGLMISVVRKIPTSMESVKSYLWKQHNYRGMQLRGKTLGIVGFGRLGSMVSKVALAMNMNVFVFDPYVNHFPPYINVCRSMDELLTQSDIISLHAPLNDETKHIISDRQIEKMKQNVVIVNTARGGLINTNALLDGLKSGKIGAAALDVLEGENLVYENNHPLIDYAKKNANLIITPHIGGATNESVKQADLFLLNKFLKNIS